MSRFDELKKQYPYLNITFLDILKKLDGTKSYKYLPLLCKVFGSRFSLKRFANKWPDKEVALYRLELPSDLRQYNIPTDNLSYDEMFFIREILGNFINKTDIDVFTQFKEYIDANLIENNDITIYNDVDSLSNAVSLVSIKKFEKELENQIIKVYEDDKWVIVKPLTFSASAKYGAGTKWCTTYLKEKSYFEKYWRTGILVYFINKTNGYKFAGYKNLDEKNDLTFWNSADNRTDFLELDIDDYLFPIIKNVFRGDDTNKNLSSNEIQEQVHNECVYLDPFKESSVLLRVSPIMEEIAIRNEVNQDLEMAERPEMARYEDYGN